MLLSEVKKAGVEVLMSAYIKMSRETHHPGGKHGKKAFTAQDKC